MATKGRCTTMCGPAWTTRRLVAAGAARLTATMAAARPVPAWSRPTLQGCSADQDWPVFDRGRQGVSGPRDGRARRPRRPADHLLEHGMDLTAPARSSVDWVRRNRLHGQPGCHHERGRARNRPGRERSPQIFAGGANGVLSLVARKAPWDRATKLKAGRLKAAQLRLVPLCRLSEMSITLRSWAERRPPSLHRLGIDFVTREAAADDHES